MGKMKKAILFSIVSLFMVILFVTTSSLMSRFRFEESEMEITRTRVRLLNSVVKEMEDVYFEKLIYVASKNALIGISNYQYENDFDGVYQKNLSKVLSLAIKNGSYVDRDGNSLILTQLLPLLFNDCKVQGVKKSCINPSYTLDHMTGDISGLLANVGFQIKTLDITILSVKQITPWMIEVSAGIDYYFTDKNNMALWKGYTTKTVDMSVIGFYSFDKELNMGVITGQWKTDNGTNQEPSFLNKISGISDLGKGICMLGCDEI